ncbi:MAG TPA: DUF4097 family beta strand repeat-containing protein [Bryobacteraceae bacterium]
MNTKSTFQPAMASAFVLFAVPAFAGGPARQTFDVGLKDPVVLDLAVAAGDVRMTYSRDGQLSVNVSAQDTRAKEISEEFLASGMTVEQDGPHIRIRTLPNRFPGNPPKVSYQIDVPSRTEVNAAILGAGNLTVIGITGPATLRTAEGKISCTRVRGQLYAETGSGNIVLIQNGPSRAVVKAGLGSIDAVAARGNLFASTDKGDVHIKAVLWDTWQVTSRSGNIRIEMPAETKFDLDAETVSGSISVERDDMQKPTRGIHKLHQQVNGGGSRVSVHTAGNIFVQ